MGQNPGRHSVALSGSLAFSAESAESLSGRDAMKAFLLAGLISTFAAGTAASQDPLSPRTPSSRARNPSSSIRHMCRLPATRLNTTRRDSRRSCAQRCSSPAYRRFRRQNVGFFTGPYPERAKLGKPVIDRADQDRPRHAPKRRDAHREVPWRPGLRDAASVARTRSVSRLSQSRADCRMPQPSPGRWAMCCPGVRCRRRSTQAS